MKKQDTQSIVFGVLLVVIVAIWGRNFKLFRERGAEQVQAGVLEGPGAGTETFVRRARRSIYPTWGRDPFFVKGGAVSLEPFTLEGIILDQDAPYIVIDGEIKKEGDTVAGAEVVSIQKTKAILRRGSQEIVLKLFSSPQNGD